MTMNPRSLVMLALVAVASAATATLAQKAGAEKPPIAGEFVKVGNEYLRISRIDGIAFTDGRVHLSVAGKNGNYDANDCVELVRALGLPPMDLPKPLP